MIMVKDAEHYKIYWHDDEKTIIIGEVHSDWTWADAHEGLEQINSAIGVEAKSHDVYVIINLTTGAQSVPRGSTAITNIYNLFTKDPGHEILKIMVTKHSLVSNLINIAHSTFDMRRLMRKLQFATRVEDAYSIIEKHKQEHL